MSEVNNLYHIKAWTMLKLRVSVYLYLFCLNCLLISCNTTSSQNNEIEKPIGELELQKEKPTDVKVIEVKQVPYSREVLVNGKLEAVRKANLRFHTNGIISSINIKASQFVRSGQLLGSLEDIQQKRFYQQNKLRYQQAVLDYEDQLLRQGYNLADTNRIDKNVISIARLRSGLSNAQLELARSQSELKNTKLICPFNGQIANLKAKPYIETTSIDYFCTLVDNQDLVVDFLILEQELKFIKNCNEIQISQFGNEDKKYTGVIESINPSIDRTGMINVKARVHNKDGALLDGMNVKVLVKNMLPSQISIPKTAVLDRQGKKVVFTVRNGGFANWNYVEIAYENSISYAIKSGLRIGDKVIYDGNFNLAHDKPVKISN